MYKNKILLGIFACSLSSIAFAANNTLADYRHGIYVGVQGGYGLIDDEKYGFEDDINDTYNFIINNFPNSNVSKEIDRGGIGGRVFLGFSIIPYLSLETGYGLYPHNTYKLNVTAPASLSDLSEDIDVSEQTFDLVGKVILPLEVMSPALAGWNVYGKFGAAWVWTDVNDGSHFNIRPAYGLGIGYNFTDAFGIDVSWTQILGGSGDTDSFWDQQIENVPATNLFAIGITYKFSWGESQKTKQSQQMYQPQYNTVNNYGNTAVIQQSQQQVAPSNVNDSIVWE